MTGMLRWHGKQEPATRALIVGVSGQDGAWLAELLLRKGYDVYGTSRDAELSQFGNLQRLGIRERVQCLSMTLTDFRSVLQVLTKVKPQEIYHLAGQSSVALSFEQPVETLESVALGTLNLLEAVRFMDYRVRVYHACSSECFGDTYGEPADENTAFRPRSPYAAAKAAAFWQVANYREAYGLFACSGILFNHESPLRPERFVTQKIITAARRVAAGSCESLYLGNLDIQRDWGWAPEYVDAMWRMLQRNTAEDFVIATGESYSLALFLELAFMEVGLNWRDYTIIDRSLFRATDLAVSRGNPARAESELGWRAQYRMADVVRMMLGE